MGFRLLLLAAMGLGAMYMMHLLAQDYDRIRRPLTKVIATALRGKREVDTNDIANVSTNWKSILARDPFSCLQSLICQLMSGTQENNTEAILFKQFIELNYRDAPSAVTKAYARGIAYGGAADGCYEDYPFCWYSAKTMLRILHWFM